MVSFSADLKAEERWDALKALRRKLIDNKVYNFAEDEKLFMSLAGFIGRAEGMAKVLDDVFKGAT